MVFSSLPSYLDPPNWPSQQQPAGGGGGGGGDHEISQLPPPLFPPPPPVGSGGGTGRPGSMSERARLAKLPQPEAAMKCPRCESTNTKFCYFNNYNLSQPRHFCKTCRRYWTRGGALRNVPVGGGCRRNKRSSSKGSRSKSPATTTSSASNNSSAISPSRCTSDILGHLAHPQPPQFPILPPLHHLGDHYGGGDNIGLTYGGGNGLDLIQIGNSSYPSSKLAQFPFMEASNGGIYQFERDEGPSNYGVGALGAQFGSKALNSGVHVNQAGGMKVEEDHNHHHQGLNLSRNFLSISGNEQFLGTSNLAWSTTDLSGFTSSSTATHLL